MTTAAFAYDERPVNLGFTSFMDAAVPPPGHGLYVIQYFSSYHSDEFLDSNGGRLGGVSSPNFNPVISITQFWYMSPKTSVFFNAHLGFNAIIPTVFSFNLQQPNNLGLKANSGGIGDPVAGIFLQWDPLMVHGRPVWFNRVQFDNFIPVGKYNKNDQINPGSNFYSFNPYWSTTVLITPNWEVSSRLHYLWNTTNDVTGIRAGDAIFDDFATSYAVIPNRLRFGVAGYYFKQLENSKGNPASNSKEQVLGLGPGAVFFFNSTTAMVLNYYDESHVINRTRGSRVVLGFFHGFGP